MNSIRHVLFLGFAAALVFFFGIQSRLIMESSEGRIARVAQEMIDRGEWVVPSLNGAVRKEKPPLSSWLVVGTTLATGSREVKAVHAFLPSAVLGVALVLMAFFWMKESRSLAGLADVSKTAGIGAFLAGLAVMTSPGLLLQARSAELDILLALLVTFAFYGFWSWREKHAAGGLVLCYVALGLTVLTKGHVGLVLFLPAILIWSVLERSRFALPGKTSSGWKWHLLGLALLLLIVLPWGIAFIQQSGITWADFNKEGGAARFGGKTGHQEPWYFYLINIPGWLMPWMLLLPLALYFTRDLPPDERSPLRRLLWCWLGWGTFLFSLLTAKQRHYAVPFMVPLALLIADAVERWWEHPKESARREALFALRILAALLVVAIIAGAIVSGDSRLRVILLFGAIALISFAIRPYWGGQTLKLESLLVGCVSACLLFVSLRDKEDLEHSPVAFCQKVRETVPKDKPLYDYNVAFANNVWRAQVLFYMGRNLRRHDGNLVDLAQRSGVYILVNDKWLQELEKDRYEILAEDHSFLGHKRHAFLIRTK